MPPRLGRIGTYLVISLLLVVILYRSKAGNYRDYVIKQQQYSDEPTLTTEDDPFDNRPQLDIQWATLPTRYPVPEYIPLPRGNGLPLPRVQYDFPNNVLEKGAAAKSVDRRNEVRAAFKKCWDSYVKHAWGADELAPKTGKKKTTFGGWGATLVDSLDTLWIMGLKDEFHEAVKKAADINFSNPRMETINVFETTIRYLGGFLSAYDLSGEKVLLEKAIEVAEMLYVAFDTPNRLPITRWKPQTAAFASTMQMADEQVLLAEIGSLSLEFTRLSQLTEDDKWYDAVQRITNLMERQAGNGRAPGMWPLAVNARKSDFATGKHYTLGAMADSVYEYLPKMYALTGGRAPTYWKLYTNAMESVKKYLLFKPMTPDNADILVSGTYKMEREGMALTAQGQHLTCFAGGMFALGGRLSDKPEHVEIGEKLTDGCIWAYEHMPLGIMPELYHMLPCPDEACKWDAKAFGEEVLHRDTKVDPKEITKAMIDAVPKTHPHLPRGFTQIEDPRYLLRPEAIESVFILYRTTGREDYLEKGWVMYQSIMKATKTALANAAVQDVTVKRVQDIQQYDSMESFWLGETLKYFYLLYSHPNAMSLDEWVFNTEAHPFSRATKKFGDL